MARTPEEWRSEAGRLEAEGDRASALRATYLELLSGLHRAGAINYDRTRTNLAYVRDVPRTHAASAPFRRLTARFDVAVYGAVEPDGETLRAARSEAQAVRAAFASGGGRGA